MGCCFCCLDESDKVDRVMEQFPGIRAGEAQDNVVARYIGHAVLAGDRPLYSPINNTPCVYFRIAIEREEIEWDEDDEGNRTERREWRRVCDEEMSTDFYLVDGMYKIFARASRRESTRIDSEWEPEQESFSLFGFNALPPGVAQYAASRESAWDFWDPAVSYRYQECVFAIGEKISCLGKCCPGQDPITGVGIKVLNPCNQGDVTEEWMDEMEWEDWDKRAWADLTEDPAIFLTDKESLTADADVDYPAEALPPWMTSYDQGYASQFQDMYVQASWGVY